MKFSIADTLTALVGTAVLVATVFAGVAVFNQNGCTPAQREKLVVPTLSQIDAIGSTIAQAAEWARDHGADEALILQTLRAVSDKDPKQAVDIVRKILEALAAKGEPIPPQIVALVQTAEGALAAEAIQDGMRALSTPTAPSAAPAPSSSASTAPLPSSGL